jgi:hypothetical protein
VNKKTASLGRADFKDGLGRVDGQQLEQGRNLTGNLERGDFDPKTPEVDSQHDGPHPRW